jgi:hypothetical protein
MRRTLIGLVAAGLLAVTGCSDSENEDGGDAASGGGSASEFCDGFEALNDRFAEDPEAASDAGQVLDDLESLDPPDEIADSYEKVIDVSRRSSEVDFEDPEAVEEMQQLGEEAAEAEEEVAAFLQDECGIDIGAPQEADSGTTTEEEQPAE